MSAQVVSLERPCKGVALITMTNPDVNNHCTWGGMDQLAEALKNARESGDKAVVLASGVPGHWFEHAWLHDLLARVEGRKLTGSDRAWFSVLTELASPEVITIAAISGACSGGGCELGWACDLRVAEEQATFAQPEIQINLSTGIGGTSRLARLVGKTLAAEMVLDGRPVFARRVFKHGGVNRLVPNGESVSVSVAWAQELVSRPHDALTTVKKALNNSLNQGLDDALKTEQSLFRELMLSENGVNGMRSVQNRFDKGESILNVYGSAQPADLTKESRKRNRATKSAASRSAESPEAAILAGWGDPIPVSYNTRDLITYAIGIGSSDLKFVYENTRDFAAFPTYPLVLGQKGDAFDVVPFPSQAMRKTRRGTGIRPKGPSLDGERYFELLKPIPRKADLLLKSRIVGIHAKKTGAVVESETLIFDKDGTEYARFIGATFLVGVTGFKPAGKSHSMKVEIPNREPDYIAEQKTAPNQAHIYRLSGDYNPLHVDPEAAKAFGFDAPIIHGLCSLGHSARHVLKAFGGNDPNNFKSLRVRFTSPFYPGETYQILMWKEENRIIFVTKVKEREKIIISNAYVDLKEVKLGSNL